MSWSWRAAEIWHCRKPGEATGDGVASVVAEAPGFKGSGRETETWHHVAESESLKRGREVIGKGASLVVSQHSGNPGTIEQPPGTALAVEPSWCEPIYTVWVLHIRAREVELLIKPL